MSCRKFKAATATPQILHHLWITDELLTDAFNRFLHVSRTHRRHGSHVPGPLEARRRLAKRRMGGAAVASSSVPPSHDVGGIFSLPGRPPPSFDREWRWQAPVPTPPLVRPGNTDTWTWPLARGEKMPGAKVDVGRVTSFWEQPRDSVETSKDAFEELLETHTTTALLDQNALQPIFDFLQSSQNEPDARLTLRLVEWLGQRSATEETLRGLVALVSQKITLRTITEAEESLIIAQLLEHGEGGKIISELIDALPGALIQPVLSRATAAILTESNNRDSLVQTWLASLRQTSVLQTSHHTSQAWNEVYAIISQIFKPSELVEHFQTLEGADLTMVVLQHWVPHLDYSLDAISAELKELRMSKEENLPQNDAAVDLATILARHEIPYLVLLEELFAFWQKSKSVQGIKDLVQQCSQAEPPIEISKSLSHSLVRPFIESEELGTAHYVACLLPNTTLSVRRELALLLIEKGRMNGNNIWKIIDTWVAELDSGAVEKPPFPDELIDIVHELAYAWSKSPHLPARVAFRRVWECYRFLYERLSPISSLLTRALVRASVLNFVRERKPFSKSRVKYILALVSKVEGTIVRKEVDRLIFDYWMATRSLVIRKPAGQVTRERLPSKKVLEDGRVKRVTWNHRVARRSIPKAGALDLEALTDELEESKPVSEADPTPEAWMNTIDNSGWVETTSELNGVNHEGITVDGSVVSLDLTRTADGLNSSSEVKELEAIALERLAAADADPATEDWTSAKEVSADEYIADPVIFEPFVTSGDIKTMDRVGSTDESSHRNPANTATTADSQKPTQNTAGINLSDWVVDPVRSEDPTSTSPNNTVPATKISKPPSIRTRRTDRDAKPREAMVKEISALRRRIYDLIKRNHGLQLAVNSAQSDPKAIKTSADEITPFAFPADHYSNAAVAGPLQDQVSGLIRKHASQNRLRLVGKQDVKDRHMHERKRQGPHHRQKQDLRQKELELLREIDQLSSSHSIAHEGQELSRPKEQYIRKEERSSPPAVDHEVSAKATSLKAVPIPPRSKMRAKRRSAEWMQRKADLKPSPEDSGVMRLKLSQQLSRHPTQKTGGPKQE